MYYCGKLKIPDALDPLRFDGRSATTLVAVVCYLDWVPLFMFLSSLLRVCGGVSCVGAGVFVFFAMEC